MAGESCTEKHRSLPLLEEAGWNEMRGWRNTGKAAGKRIEMRQKCEGESRKMRMDGKKEEGDFMRRRIENEDKGQKMQREDKEETEVREKVKEEEN